ncbi:phytoene desaturase family protein [Modestobacter roseus]|uniref:Phytoene dehydrogenase-like protein n=1 Tax=Modestobacter roseus TaxID=1181884 RepID=A0A562IUN7_9ACTN|nr:NAD(P)/FAD-dependent oxidoreductase [Modestobacter roseus]MQA32882.1 FAD-dependent oxidoreductase [Modestobacter roseus]TWH74668.1 phytoene dehydrogenase-like protein [Modestobacter roseus]
MSTAARYDAVVVGGGHNGLVAAAYLARAGWSVLVLERRDVLGGAAVSQQVFPGVDVRLSAYSYLVSLLPDRIVTDLGLPLDLRDRAVASWTPLRRDGRHRSLLVERDEGPATAASFRALTGSDAELAGWQRFYGRLSTLAEDLAPTLTEPLPGEAELAGRLRDPGIWHDLRERPLADVVGDHLTDDDVRGIALTDGLIGTFADVHAADGLAGRCFLYHLVGNGTGRWRVPVGGMGAVSGAIATAARAAGATLLTGATVTALETRADGVTVHWTDADGVAHAADAGHLVGGAAPAVLDDLLGAPAGPRPSGSQLKVNMVLRRLPGLRSGDDPHRVFSGTVHVDESASAIDAAYAKAAAGQLPDVVPFEVYCHSLTDPSITGGTGLHTLTLFGLHTPAELFAADPVGTREEAVRRVVAQFDDHLTEPLADCLAIDAEGRPCLQAASPLDVEAALAMPGGHIFHGDLSWPVATDPAQAGTWGVATSHPRVVAASSGGTVRGGAVSGLGGFAAAQHLLGR